METPMNSGMPMSTPGSASKLPTILVTVLITVVVLIGAMYALGFVTSRSDEVVVESVTPSASSTEQRTYSSVPYGFEFTYPTSFLLTTSSSDFLSLQLNSIEQASPDPTRPEYTTSAYTIGLELSENPYVSDEEFFKKQEEYMNNPDNEARGSWKMSELAGKKWVEVWGYPGICSMTTFKTPHEKYVYEFTYESCLDDDIRVGEIFNQVLPTFRFTK